MVCVCWMRDYCAGGVVRRGGEVGVEGRGGGCGGGGGGGGWWGEGGRVGGGGGGREVRGENSD